MQAAPVSMLWYLWDLHTFVQGRMSRALHRCKCLHHSQLGVEDALSPDYFGTLAGSCKQHCTLQLVVVQQHTVMLPFWHALYCCQ